MLTKYRDFTAGLFLLSLGALMLATSGSIPKGAEMGVGADFMPKLMSILLIVSGGAVMLMGWYRNNTLSARSEAEERTRPGAVVLSLVNLGVFIALLSRIGFIPMTFAYIFLQTELFSPPERRSHGKFTVISAVATAAIYLIFAKGFKILLPAGLLG